MIKPHGSDTLNPLYVRDDAKRAALVKESEGLPSIVVCSAAAARGAATRSIPSRRRDQRAQFISASVS